MIKPHGVTDNLRWEAMASVQDSTDSLSGTDNNVTVTLTRMRATIDDFDATFPNLGGFVKTPPANLLTTFKRLTLLVRDAYKARTDHRLALEATRRLAILTGCPGIQG